MVAICAIYLRVVNPIRQVIHELSNEFTDLHQLIHHMLLRRDTARHMNSAICHIAKHKHMEYLDVMQSQLIDDFLPELLQPIFTDVGVVLVPHVVCNHAVMPVGQHQHCFGRKIGIKFTSLIQ